MNVYLTVHPKRMLLTCYEWDETHGLSNGKLRLQCSLYRSVFPPECCNILWGTRLGPTVHLVALGLTDG